MSRLASLLIVLLAIAVATPVLAEDRLALSGSMDVRGWYLDDGGDNTETFADHRLRVGGKISVAEGVSVTFRTDMSESDEWGTDAGFGRQGYQIDRAHLDIAKGMFTLRGGQQLVFIGNGTIDSQDTALVVGTKGQVPVQLGYMLTESNGGKTSADDHIIFTTVSHKTDMYNATVYVANARNRNLVGNVDKERDAAYDAAFSAEFSKQIADGEDFLDAQNAALAKATEAGNDFDTEFNPADYAGEDVYVIGLASSFNLDVAKVDFDLAYFTGDFAESENIDAMGTQMRVDASLAATETVTVGGAVYFALAADNDEVQVTSIGNGFNGWDPINYGPLANENLFAQTRVYDFTGDNAGVIGAQLYLSANVTNDMVMTGSAAYLTPEDDDNTTIDSQVALNLGMTYAVMSNTNIAAQVQFVDNDEPNSDSMVGAGLGLFVNF